MENKTYITAWAPIALIGFTIILLLIIVQSLRDTVTNSLYGSLFIAVPMLIAVLLLRFATYIKINSVRIKNRNFGYHYREFDVSEITKIEKKPLYYGLGWGFGYQLFIYFDNDLGILDATHINLNHYSKKTVSDFLNDLKKLSPSIQIDDQAERLME